MASTHRTFLRVFLLLGGLAFLGAGALEGSVGWIALGLVATGVGAFGIWSDMREAAEQI